MRTKKHDISKSKDVLVESIIKDDSHLVISRIQFLDKGPDCIDRYQIRHNGVITVFSPFKSEIENRYRELIGEKHD